MTSSSTPNGRGLSNGVRGEEIDSDLSQIPLADIRNRVGFEILTLIQSHEEELLFSVFRHPNILELRQPGSNLCPVVHGW